MAIADAAVAELPIAAEVFNTFAEAISETASAADSVSVLVIFESLISETMSAGDVPSADGIVGGTVAETASAADTVVGVVDFPVTIGESAVPLDTVGASGTFAVAVAESASASDTITVTQFGLRSRLVFTDVVPSPELQGPGNPGKLKLALVSVQIYPPIRGWPTR